MRKSVVWSTCALLVAGCVSGNRALRRRASSDLSCPEARLELENQGAGLHQVSGCGRWARYVCNRDDPTYSAPGGQLICIQQETGLEDGITPYPGGDAMARECGVGDAQVVVRVRSDGRPARIEPWPGETEAVRDCLASLLVAHPIEPAPGRPSTMVVEARASSAGGERPVAETPPPPPAEPSAAVPETPSDPDPREVRVRELLDARAEDVLACVGRARQAVRVRVDEDGTMAFGLSNAAGSPEEGCVRDALAELRVEAGAELEIVHLVRASEAAAP